MNEAIEQWHWYGSSIDDIERFAAGHNLSMLYFVEQHFSQGWPESAP